MRTLITKTATYRVANGRVDSFGSTLCDLRGALLVQPIEILADGRARIVTRDEPQGRTTTAVYFDGITDGPFVPARMVTNRGTFVVASDLCWDCGRKVRLSAIGLGRAPLSRINGDSKYGYEPCCESCHANQVRAQGHNDFWWVAGYDSADHMAYARS